MVRPAVEEVSSTRAVNEPEAQARAERGSKRPRWRFGLVKGSLVVVLFPMLYPCSAVSASSAANPKTRSAFFPPELIARARENARTQPWAAEMRDRIVKAAQPWMKLSDEQLWSLMFGNTIKRSWMVWSNGHCPACKKSVPMYNWKPEPLKHPWKMRCPHCEERFPKNDFGKFHASGLDEHGVFDAARADRSLLFNVEHPDPSDPLHKFGVDDGEGYVDGEKRWRFIGAYLIYGQWKKAIVDGISNLAAAYAVTGEQVYAHKAAVLLDRAADLYPTFDFGKEGVMYEGSPRSGYISTWHDACWEVHVLAIAYDQIFDGLQQDDALVAFLRQKAEQFKPALPKTSVADIRSNIEQRILLDTLANRPKIESNYPMTDSAIVLIKTVLAWPANRDEVMGLLDGIIKTATAVDGLTGEKGLDGYASIAPHMVAETLGRYMRVDPTFLKDMLARHPRIRDMFRFHIDTWCLERFYPRTGDTGSFARPSTRYDGVGFSGRSPLEPSGYAFLWQLYEFTQDADFVRVLYNANGNKVNGLPYDLFSHSPAGFQEGVAEVIAREGTELQLGDVNKQQWNLAILRSGRGDDRRALWLDYDSGERHGHADAMNLGLFARGLDLMPDFGYPPVHYGGWGSPRSAWYTISHAHNTVVIDGKSSLKGTGKTTLWASGERFRAIRASAPALASAQQFERTAALVDVSPQDSYAVDVFRVVGGTDHMKYMHSSFATLETQGLALGPAEGEVLGLQMQDFKIDRKPQMPWSVDFNVEDRFKLNAPDARVQLRYTDLTPDAEALTGMAWISMGFTGNEEAHIPRVMVRRRAKEGPLATTFLALIEPHAGNSNLKSIRRLPLRIEGTECGPNFAGLEITLADGRRDLFISADVENPQKTEPAWAPGRALVQEESKLRLDGQVCLVRTDAEGRPLLVALCRASSLSLGDLDLRLRPDTEYVEIAFDDSGVRIAAGAPDSVERITMQGNDVTPRSR